MCGENQMKNRPIPCERGPTPKTRLLAVALIFSCLPVLAQDRLDVPRKKSVVAKVLLAPLREVRSTLVDMVTFRDKTFAVAGCILRRRLRCRYDQYALRVPALSSPHRGWWSSTARAPSAKFQSRGRCHDGQRRRRARLKRNARDPERWAWPAGLAVFGTMHVREAYLNSCRPFDCSK